MAVTDLISKATTVTVANGTNVIQVADKTNLAVDDEVLIESQHGYNEAGLGGSFSFTPAGAYYFASGITVGKSIYAIITNISGNDITLNTTVPAEAVGVPLYRDNEKAVKAKIEAGTSWAAYEDQTFHVGNRILPVLTDDSEQEFDFNNVEFKSPKGCCCVAIYFQKSGGGVPSHKTYRNLRITGNVADSGYGPTTGYTGGQTMNKTFHLIGHHVVVDNVTITDVWMSFLLDFCEDCVVQNSTIVRNHPLRTYWQWDVLPISSKRCVFDNITYDSDYPAPFCEAAKSRGIVFSNCTSRNGIYSINTSGGTRYINCSAVWDWSSDGSANVMTPTTAYWPVTRQFEQSDGYASTGTEGGTLLLGCSIDIQAITFPPNRICYCHNTQQPLYGIDTNMRVYDETYTNAFPASDTNNANFGYWVYGDVNDESIEVGGDNSVTQLTGITQRKYTRYVNGVLTVMPVPGES